MAISRTRSKARRRKPRCWGCDMGSPRTLSDALTVGAAMAIGIECQKRGHIEQAADIYREILEQVPDHADAMHYLGVIAHQQGRHEEAVALIERSLVLAPARADCHSNLGIVLKARGRVHQSVAAFTQAIQLDLCHVLSHSI